MWMETPKRIKDSNENYFVCKKKDHFAHQCTNITKLNDQDDVKPRVNARLYALSEGEGEAKLSTIVTS